MVSNTDFGFIKKSADEYRRWSLPQWPSPGADSAERQFPGHFPRTGVRHQRNPQTLRHSPQQPREHPRAQTDSPTGASRGGQS